jgi:hypothetical protein
MKIETVLITPAMAKDFLEKSIGNRVKKERRIIKYAKDMLEGKWICETAEPVKFSICDKLIDGHNRMHAIMRANISVKLQVATGLNKDIFKVIDTGCSRNASDVFKIDKVNYSNTAPSIIAVHNKLLNGLSSDNSHNFSSQKLLDLYYERESFYNDVFRKADKFYVSFNRVLIPSIVGGFYAFFFDINPIHANEFFEQLTSGNDIKHNAIKLLRNKLFDDKLSSKKLSIPTKHALLIKTWNYYRKNQQIKILKYDADTEQFPKAI